eukprot:gene16105-19101_t
MRKAEYAVRGELLEIANEIQKELDAGTASEKYNFTKIIKCNIGNPQAVGQQPLTFHRQLLSLIANPQLLQSSTMGNNRQNSSSSVSSAIVSDRAHRGYIDGEALTCRAGTTASASDSISDRPDRIHSTDGETRGVTDYPPDVVARAKEFNLNLGGYSDSRGHLHFRELICDFVNARDGCIEPLALPDSVFITDGASQAIKTVLELLIRDEHDVILIPVPQ